MASDWIEVDWDAFQAWRVLPVRHRLFEHRLLQLPAVSQLGVRLEQAGRVRTHSDGATAGTPFNAAPQLHPNPKTAVETLGDLEHARAWMLLLNIETDAIYRHLVDEVLEGLRAQIDRRDPGMSRRAGWIFVSSPRAVTPFHVDREHNFILQISGRKRLYAWEPDDLAAVTEPARDLFHETHSRDLIVWRDALKLRAHVFDLEPGMGAYLPSTAPHMVENGDGPSITVSFTYYTDATRRNRLLHQLHHRLRARGWRPPPVGERPARDAALHAAASALLTGTRALRRLKADLLPIRR